jgi:hypothetical protein
MSVEATPCIDGLVVRRVRAADAALKTRPGTYRVNNA